MAMVLSLVGRYGDAIEIMRKGIGRNPDAIDALNKVITINPNKPESEFYRKLAIQGLYVLVVKRVISFQPSRHLLP
jgi:hypothetical protein